MLLFGILVGLFILVLLVAVHELGHGIVARRNGVIVEEFGIGFPPKAWGKKVKKSILGKNVLFTLNWLPLGGFVKLQGEYDSARKKGDYGAASYWTKTKILLAGVLMNWLIAALIFTVLALVGLPKILPNQFSVTGDTQIAKQPVQVTTVEHDSPAQKAGLKQGDQLLRFNGADIPSSEDLVRYTKENAGKKVEIIYLRGGAEKIIPVTLRAENADKKGFLGVASGQREEIKATWSAPIVGAGTTLQYTWVTLEGTAKIAWNTLKGAAQSLAFWDTATRSVGNEKLNTVGKSVAGPVGILGIIFPQAQAAGLKQLVFLAGIISLSLAVMNVLPIPALDGGRWFTMTAFRLLKKPLTKEREEKIQVVGFWILISLVILVTWADVGKFTH